MLRLTLFLALFCLFTGVNASDTIVTYAYGGDIEDYIWLSPKCEILFDVDEAYSIDRILLDSTLQFAPHDRAAPLPELPFTVWNRIRLTNTGQQSRHDYFVNYIYSDSVWMYVVENDQVIENWVTGSGIYPSDKYAQNTGADLPFSLEPGVTRDYYFKIKHSTALPWLRTSLTLLSIYPGAAYSKQHSQRVKWEFFYAGTLTLCALVSFFMFIAFRERVFIYFGSLMVFMVGYFLATSMQLGPLLDITRLTTKNVIFPVLMAGLLAALYLFLSKYLQFRENFPRANRVYRVFSLLLVCFPVIGSLFGNFSFRLHDVVILCWILVTVAAILWLAWRGDKAAKVMLLSISAILLGSLWTILSGQGIIAQSRMSYIGFQGGTLLFSVIIFYGLFDKVSLMRKAKREAEALEQLKSRFFTNISHEFRTPLTLMLGPLEQAMEISTDPKQRRLIDMAHRNAGRQLALVRQLLDLSKADSGELRLRAAEQDFIPFLKGTVFAYSSLAEQKNIELVINGADDAVMLWFDREKMEQIVYNLLTNAFKFTPGGGEVSITVGQESGMMKLQFSDSGIGIPEDRLPYVFDRFFRGGAENQREYDGYGIGLALVKELVLLHQGTIQLSSEVAVGTTVNLDFPLGSAHLAPGQISSVDAPIPSVPQVKPGINPDPGLKAPPVDKHAVRDRILIIEDNADVRAFIRQRLDVKYDVYEAVDGDQGIRKALRDTPDLIISDVMMPGKDGYEVCKTLKMDVRTSHIPIILLTAKAAREEKLEGLETGADDYLTKPFDGRELEIRISNLIQLREQLRQRFAIEISLQPSEVATNSLDQDFLANVLATVEENLTEVKFGVEDLARAVNISRSNLNRKLRALVNQSSNQFIQSIRLQRAAELLRQQAGTVGEIAFQTGFSSTAYFVKCFRDKYGVTPGSILK